MANLEAMLIDTAVRATPRTHSHHFDHTERLSIHTEPYIEHRVAPVGQHNGTAAIGSS